MKRFRIILAVLLTFAMTVLCFTGCGETETEAPQSAPATSKEESSQAETQKAETPKGLRVGYGFTDIMPEESIPLDSYGNADKRYSTGYLNKIYFTAIAITDEDGQTLLLLDYDITQCDTGLLEELKKYASDQYGVDPDYVHLSGTHTHSSVALGLNVPVVQRYKQKLTKQAKAAIDEAFADQKAAELYYGETKTEKLNFVRHYIREDGTSCGDNHGNWSTAKVVKHVKDPDETMRLIKFTRTNEDGTAAKDVVLANWQAHNHLTGGSTQYNIASDWSGAFRTEMEKAHNCQFAFFQGCAGDLNPKDNRIGGENRTEDYREHGKLLAGYASEIYDSMTKVENTKIKAIKKTVTAEVNHDLDDLKSVAREIVTNWQVAYDNNAAVKAGEKYGIHSPYMASAIVNRASMASTGDFEVWAFQIGDIGWTQVPLEMFDTTGENIRAASPYRMTFTQGYSNASLGYLPTQEAYVYGCYEADTTKWRSGTAELVQQTLISMLKELHE